MITILLYCTLALTVQSTCFVSYQASFQGQSHHLKRATAASAPRVSIEVQSNLGTDGPVSLRDRESSGREASSQDDSNPAGPIDQADEIRVTGRQLRGAVLSKVEPLRVLNQIDVRAYGARSVEDLVNALGNELVSSREGDRTDPVVLLNGRRISSFEEIAAYPPEAIERAELFPELLAVEYGFPPNQKVVNLVTFERFQQGTGQANLLRTAEGGGTQAGATANYIKINRNLRYSAGLDARQTSQILESQRGIIQNFDSPDQGRVRSLVPERREIGASFGVAGSTFLDSSFSLSASGRLTETEALLGISAERLVRQGISGSFVNLGSSLTGRLASWTWTHTAKYNYTHATNNVGFAGESSTTNQSNLKLESIVNNIILNGDLFYLPAGAASLAVRFGFQTEDIKSETYSLKEASSGQDPLALSRSWTDIFGTLTLPLLDGDGRLGLLGNLSASATIRLQKYSGRDELLDRGLNVIWKPAKLLRLSLSAESQSASPTLLQLASPLVSVPNFRTFDFATGRTVDVIQITGGNTNLLNERSRLLDVTATISPIPDYGLYFTAGYSRIETTNKIENFPILTSPILQSFSNRVQTDGQGRVFSVDFRPINIFAASRRALNLGVNWTRQLGSPAGQNRVGINPNPGGELPLGLVPPDSKIIYAPPGTALPPELINTLSRIFFNLRYTYRLDDRVRLTANAPELDLLNGFALTALGGPPRHNVRISGGVFRHGLGFNFDVDWRSKTSIVTTANIASLPASTLKLDFSPHLNVLFFLNPEENFNGNIAGLLEGLQISIRLDNLLNARPSVSNQSGLTPLRFQAAYLEPQGKLASLTVRKTF